MEFGRFGRKSVTVFEVEIYHLADDCDNPRHSQKERKFRVDVIKCDR